MLQFTYLIAVHLAVKGFAEITLNFKEPKLKAISISRLPQAPTNFDIGLSFRYRVEDPCTKKQKISNCGFISFIAKYHSKTPA